MTYSCVPPFLVTSGPRHAKIVIVGEAWGETEDKLKLPFVGESGKELWRMLGEAWPEASPELWSQVTSQFNYGLESPKHWSIARESWLQAESILLTNVFNLRPMGNKIETLCASRAEVGGPSYKYPSLSQGKYLKLEYLSELNRLNAELAFAKPNLVICLGNTALWALMGQTTIGSVRGAVAKSALGGVKVLATYHPAGVMRQWAWRPIVIADLIKARSEAQFPELLLPSRQVLISPSIDELETWTSETLAMAQEGLVPKLSPDIETYGGQIKCIGFARSRSEALVIPFIDESKPGWSYWPSRDLEERAWLAVQALLESPISKVGQNFIYDLQYLMPMGLRPRALDDDTMLLHHSMFPEMQKGLGFLGSIYTNESSWKLMRRHKADTEKRDE